MKKKHANAGMTLYADYVVPVYNLNTDARYLATYENDEACVDIWAAKAKLNDEYASMQHSLLRAENKERAALDEEPDNEDIRMNLLGLKSVRELFINPKYHQVIDNELKLIVAKYLREQYMKTDLDHAKYLVGFSIFNCFKEAMR